MAPITARASLKATRAQLVRSRAEVRRLNRHVDQLQHALELTRVDPLTGLLTRNAWHEQAEQFIATTSGGSFVLLLDLNGFKDVNDTYGHACGDALLEIQAQRLALWVRDRGHAGRLGGDELVAVVELDDSERDIASLGSILSRPLLWNGQQVEAPASIGVALAAGGHGLDVLMAAADRAMYRAKVGQQRLGWWRFALDEEYAAPEAAPVHRARHRDRHAPTAAR